MLSFYVLKQIGQGKLFTLTDFKYKNLCSIYAINSGNQIVNHLLIDTDIHCFIAS